jgi:cytochrome oxidase assembly protein ShyY1
VALFDGTEEHPPSKIRRYIITSVAFVILVALGCWYLLRFHKETNTVKQFSRHGRIGQLRARVSNVEAGAKFFIQRFYGGLGAE